MRVVSTSIDALAFQHTEEALTGGIVSAAANAAHAAGDVVALQESLILSACKLTAAIGVQH